MKNPSGSSAGANRSVQLDSAQVKRAREVLGVSREELARRSRSGSPLSETTIKRAERGAAVYLSTAGRLAEMLGVPLAQLLSSPPVDRSESHPSLVITPFRFELEGPHHARSLASGLSQELIARLSRHWFPVISLPYMDDTRRRDGPEPTPNGAQPHAQGYVVRGSVQTSSGRLRVTAELAETATGRILWCRRYQRDISRTFEVQDDLVAHIANGIEPTLLDAEVKRLDHRSTDLDAWQQGMLGTWHFYRRTTSDNAAARTLLERAIRRDPHMLHSWYTLALTHYQSLAYQWTESPANTLKDLREVGLEMERRYPNESRTHVVLAYLALFAGSRAEALDRTSAAVEDDPNLSRAYIVKGITGLLNGEPDRGIERLETALHLSPLDTDRWTFHMMNACSHFAAQRYEQAIFQAERAHQLHAPNLPSTHGVIASAHGHMGNIAEARRAFEQMRGQAFPSGPGGLMFMSSINAELKVLYLEGLNRAGLV